MPPVTIREEERDAGSTPIVILMLSLLESGMS